MIQGITLLNTIASVSIFLGFTLSLSLIFKKSQKNKANLFLGLLVFSYTLYLIPSYLYGAKLLMTLPHFIHIGPLFTFAQGPLIWLYVLACTQEKFQFKSSLYLHFVPLVVAWIYHIPFLGLSGTEKYDIFLAFMEQGKHGFHPLDPPLKMIHTSIYFGLSLSVILRYRNHLAETASFIDKSYHRWLLFFCSVLILLILSLLIISFTEYQIISVKVLAFSFITFIGGVYAAVLMKPELFKPFPYQMETTTIEEKRKYESSNLQDHQKDRLVKKLIEYVEVEKAYQEAELSLRQLSEQLNIPSHYLSQIINERLNQSFLEFINSYRIEAAKKMLTNHEFDHYTILSIAVEAGFNSKTAFYTAFKKYTHTTPSKFRKSLTNKDLGMISV